MRNFKFMFLFFIVLSYTSGSATNYYISNGGSNSNNGLSPGMAFLTIQHAIDSETLLPGDSIIVADGNYAGFDNRSHSGTAGNPLVFYASGTNVRITSSGPLRGDGINIENVDYNVIDGFIVNNMPGSADGIRLVNGDFHVVRNCTTIGNGNRGIFTGFTDDILIENNECANSVLEHGIYVSNSSDRATIRNNVCYGNNAAGIHMNADVSIGGDGISDGFKIYGNWIFENNQAGGLNMDGIRDAEIFNNVIFDNHSAQGIALFQIDAAVPSTGAKIFNNTIIVPSDGRWGILLRDGSHAGATIYNNIILTRHPFRGCIATFGTTNLESDFNVLMDRISPAGDDPSENLSLSQWQSNTGLDQNSLVAGSFDDLFVDTSLHDFHLKENALARDMGSSDVAQIVTTDFDGLERPLGNSFDIGAYEFNEFLVSDCDHEFLHVSVQSGTLFNSAFNITSDANLTSGTISFTAQNSVKLLPGFEAAGTIFSIDILDCSEH